MPWFTDTLNIYPSPVYQVLMLIGLLFEGHFAIPSKSQLEQWHQWRVQIRQWDLGLLPLTLWSTHMLLATLEHYGCPWGVPT